MAQGTLHAIAIKELQETNSSFTMEYHSLIDQLTFLIKKARLSNPIKITTSSFVAKFDSKTNEPVLDIYLGSAKFSLVLLIHVCKNGSFTVKHNNAQSLATTASEVIKIFTKILSQENLI